MVLPVSTHIALDTKSW